MSFAALSNDEQIARLQRLAEAALAAWALDGARVEPIKYRENAVFRATGPDAVRHVIRVHRPHYRTDAQIRSEAAWATALARSGIPTPAFVPTRDGALLTTVAVEGVPEPRQCDVLAWVDGAPLGSLEHGVDLGEAAIRSTYRTVGEIAARVHAHADTWERPVDFARPAWDAETLLGETPTFGRFWELEAVTEPQRRVLFAARDRARARLLDLGAPRQLIHGDLIPDNLLAGANGVRVIDWDDCGWSWAGFELATSLFALRTGRFFDVAREAWLQGYRALRRFPEVELDAMPAFSVARGLSYLGWPAGRPEIEPMQKVVPYLAKAITELAERYLADGL